MAPPSSQDEALSRYSASGEVPRLVAGGGAGEGAAGFAPRAVAAGYGPGAAPPDVPGLGERREAQRRAGAICSPGRSSLELLKLTNLFYLLIYLHWMLVAACCPLVEAS